MVIDQQNLFSDSQLITTSANSTNVIDNLGNQVLPTAMVAQPIGVFARVLQAFAGGTSLQIAVVSADDAALTTNVVTHFQTTAIATVALAAGSLALGVHVPPQKLRKYLGLKYTVVGTMTSGSILAGLAEDIDTVMKPTDFGSGYAVL
ncbi:hypothetical protein ASG35_03050 [Burkholderia sp. Leaf177]|uniref:Bbp16 family capsid cement protein n=1 Tax=Burkholderia sp. Leaf177 TaxID=1736287 RepID=UPI0006F48BE1|nr:hypothetical protein [Burkholderia sp. Leaf177]KQR90203.1 hypothetical protein ASG35_03050 [Burkholderia sp. Leaf177]